MSTGPGAHAVLSMLITLTALLLYTQSRIRLEYSSAVVLFVLIVAFEWMPYRGPPIVSEPVEDVTREVSPSVTNEIAPDSEATVADPDTAPVREVLLRGSDFLLGFGNEALITICMLLVLAKGIERTGALRPLGRALARMWLVNRHAALLLTLLVSGFLSAFVNNTPVVVMMISLLLGVSAAIGISPSRILMPTGFGAILGGMCTTIGTSTNLLVSSVSERLGGPRFDLLDFALPGGIAAVIGIFYLWTVAPLLLPVRESAVAGPRQRSFRSIVRVDDPSGFIGRTLADILRDVDGSIRIERVKRGGRLNLARLPSLVLQRGDLLHVLGPPNQLEEFLKLFGSSVDEPEPSGPEHRLAEIVVTQSSPLYGKRFSELGEATWGKLTAVGIHRARENVPEEEDNPKLDTGDVLLVQGSKADVDELSKDATLLVLDRTVHVVRTGKAPLAAVIFFGVVVTAAFGVTSLMVSAMSGVGLMLASRCVSWDESWHAIDTRLVLVIVTSLALGTSLSATGATDFLARAFTAGTEGLPPAAVLFGLLIVTALLTEVVTNNAIAVIATPIAIGVANQLELSPTPFVLAVLFGSNMSFLTPIGYQTNLLVLTAGNYRFWDFARAGLPLQVLLAIVLGILLPALYL